MNGHESLIRRTTELVAAARERGNHPFGALLAIDGQIALEAENTVITGHDPTRHAELNLLRQTWKELDRERIERSTLYTSTEPCPMCIAAIHYSRIPRVVFSVSQKALGEMTGSGFAAALAGSLKKEARRTGFIGSALPEEGRRVHEGFW